MNRFVGDWVYDEWMGVWVSPITNQYYWIEEGIHCSVNAISGCLFIADKEQVIIEKLTD